MGWEDLPPEVPTWKHMPATAEALALVISHEGHIAKLEERIKVSDEHFKESVEMYMETINGLESRVKELEAELAECNGKLLAYKQDFPKAVSDLEQLRAERDRLVEKYNELLDV